jgi:hypothetical protein
LGAKPPQGGFCISGGFPIVMNVYIDGFNFYWRTSQVEQPRLGLVNEVSPRADLGSEMSLSEQLDDHGMSDATVDDLGCCDAALHAGNRGANHAA